MTVFTLSNLHEATTGPKPARLAVIGQPIGHSASPRMHQPALDEAGIDARYIALEVEPGQVAEAFSRMRELGFIGCNVTVPHKFDALAACDVIEEAARDLGAVNTVRFDPDATRGTNTDGYGFEQAVLEAFDFELAGAEVAIVGAGGGAGGAIASHCAKAGVSTLVLANRTVDKLTELVRRLQARGCEALPIALDSPDLVALVGSAQLIVNTTSLGLREDDPSPMPPECFRPGQRVFDTIYKPTALIRAAEAAGAQAANGSLMLLHQGVAAFRFWFPGSHPTAAMRRGLASPT